MQTRFYIERRKDGSGSLLLKDRPVFMTVSFHGDRLMFSTGVKTDFHAWDPELQQVKTGIPGSVHVNSWLETLSATAEKAWFEVSSGSDKPDGERFRKVFRDLKPRYSSGFFSVFFLFLESGMKKWSTATYQKVRTIYKHLREFDDATAYGISFGNINKDFLGRFQTFYAEKGNSIVTTQKAINIVVWFMNWATENGYNVSRDYRGFYKAMEKGEVSPPEPLFLKWDELQMLRTVKPDSKRKERVRDLFCFICFAGLRFSELQSLQREDVLDDEIIIRRNAKVRRSVPMNMHAREIHLAYENKYYLNNTAFPSMSIITMNKYLRILGMEAGLNRLVDSGSDTEAQVPLYTRLTAGIGLHTFLANAIELDIPYEIVSGFTGIRTSVQVQRIKKVLEKAQLSKLDAR